MLNEQTSANHKQRQEKFGPRVSQNMNGGYITEIKEMAAYNNIEMHPRDFSQNKTYRHPFINLSTIREAD